MTEEGEHVLESARSVLVVDWPSRDVPETLVRGGYGVIVKGGPGPQDYSVHELRDGKVVARDLAHPPDQVDLVYCHRPLDELAGILAAAKELGAHAIWYQSGLDSSGAKHPKGCWIPEPAARQARSLVESAGLRYIADFYIADVVRQLDDEK